MSWNCMGGRGSSWEIAPDSVECILLYVVWYSFHFYGLDKCTKIPSVTGTDSDLAAQKGDTQSLYVICTLSCNVGRYSELPGNIL